MGSALGEPAAVVAGEAPRTCAEFRHPTQTSLLRLCIYQQPGGFLVTEERLGSEKVIGTLGFFGTREEAADCADRRVDDLLAQRWEQSERRPSP